MTTDVDRLMKRCQVGVCGRSALDEAHDILAECYGTLGRQQIEIERLTAELAAMTADRDSWAGQASQRTQDAVDLVAKERERCAQIVSAYPVPVGNSAAGEMAAEWTMDALREIRDAIRGA